MFLQHFEASYAAIEFHRRRLMEAAVYDQQIRALLIAPVSAVEKDVKSDIRLLCQPDSYTILVTIWAMSPFPKGDDSTSPANWVSTTAYGLAKALTGRDQSSAVDYVTRVVKAAIRFELIHERKDASDPRNKRLLMGGERLHRMMVEIASRATSNPGGGNND